MAAGLSRPEVYFGIAINRDPNDPYTSPLWTAANPSGDAETFQLRKVTGSARGRNFELDESLAADPQLLIRDVQEYLNVDNPSSPYVNLVESYRESLMLASWPPSSGPYAPPAGQVNLFNADNWRGNKEDAHDGSFESFAVGQELSWALQVGSTIPLVGSTTPFQGSRNLTWTTAATTQRQGASWPVQTIPGQQYTISAYVRQSSASTQRISVMDQVLGSDPFNTTAAATWGTDWLAHAWTVQAGSAAELGRGSLRATIALSASTAEKIVTIDTGQTDHTTHVRLIAPDPALVGNNGVGQGLVVRCNGSANYINPRVMWRNDGTVGLVTFKRVGGAGSTVVAEVPTGWSYTAGQVFILEADTTTTGANAVVASRVWPEGKPRPDSAQNSASAADAALLTGTLVGCLARSDSTTGITYPFTTHFAAFDCTGWVHGSTTAATGAYNRLTVTFTATQPVHTVCVATAGTALAGTVLLDALQHEPGAAASAYTTLGPGIYPIFRYNLEQFPRVWGSKGFEGYTAPPAVDGLAALQAITLETEYMQALLGTGPDYLWRLSDGQDTGLFADTSGVGLQPMQVFVSKYGAGTAPEPGTQIAITGDPGATGVEITALNTGSGTTRPGSALGVGSAVVGAPAWPFPPALGTTAWAMTFSCVFDVTTHPVAGHHHTLISLGQATAGASIVNPMWLFVDSTGATLISFSGSGSTQTLLIPRLGLENSGPHHIVATVSQDATNSTYTVWLDGVKTGGTVATATAGYLRAGSNTATLGVDAIGEVAHFANGTLSRAAIWTRALTDAEVNWMYAAYITGFANETAGGRVARHFVSGGYHGPTRITGNPPGTTMQAPSWSGTRDLLADTSENAAAEAGDTWVAPDGYAVFETRNDRWLRLTPSYVLGEDESLGELPYLDDGLVFAPDPLFVYANVQVGRNNGALTQGGTAAEVAAVSKRYFPRAFGPVSFDFADDEQPQDMADFVFHSHRAPLVRVAEIVMDPLSNPGLWPFVLRAEVGQRVTAVRRAKAANGGAGITMRDDYFIEKVTIEEISFGKDAVWRYRYQLSPIGASGAPSGPTMQPWILGDPTYGVLDITTVLGW